MAVLAILLSGSTGWLWWAQTRVPDPSTRAPIVHPEPPAAFAKLGAPAAMARPGVLPTTAVSQYLKTTSSTRLFQLGCAEAMSLSTSTAESAVSVLAFGRPIKQETWQWGASLFGRGFRSTGQIRLGTQAYADGYVRCSLGGPRLTVAIGTSNYGPGVTFRHGWAWALMVNAANQWVLDMGYAGRVEFAGANDIELSWNGPGVSKAWVRGYDSVADWPYFDFGDAAECPPQGNCLGAWTPEDVWYVSWGARSAWPLPQIYTANGLMAQQWYRLSLYSYLHHCWHMSIAGALSQRVACLQSSDPCTGLDNSPARAWGQLNRLLNGDTRTAQELPWSSDFSWGF